MQIELQYQVTNLEAAPTGIGNVSDYLMDCVLHYEGSVSPKEHHMFIARLVLARYRREFAARTGRVLMSGRLWCMEVTMRVDEGSGMQQFIAKDGTAVRRHRREGVTSSGGIGWTLAREMSSFRSLG